MNTGDTHGTDPFEHDAGAYVLGALSERDAAEFAAHLERCPACARSVAEVAHLPALLDRVPPADVRRLARGREDDDPPGPVGDLDPPPTLLPALLSRASGARPRPRWRGPAFGLAAAAVAGVLALGAAELVESRTDGGGPQAAAPPSTASASPAVRPLVLRPVGRQPITAAVRLEPVGWGTRIELTCAYSGTSSRYQPGTAYSLVVLDPFGNRQQIATWNGIAGRTLTVPAATSLRSSVIRAVEVRRSDGQLLLTASP